MTTQIGPDTLRRIADALDEQSAVFSGAGWIVITNTADVREHAAAWEADRAALLAQTKAFARENRLVAQLTAELAAARAEVARLTDMLLVCECGHHAVAHEGRRLFCNMRDCGCTALRGQPAPAQLRCICEHFPDGEEEGEGAVMTIRNRNCPVHADTAPTQGKE